MDDQLLVIGFHAVEELLRSGEPVSKVFVNKSADTRKIGVLRKLAKRDSCPLQLVPIVKLQRLTKQNHQGVIALRSPISFSPLEETITQLYERGKPPRVVVVDGIQDVRNLGAIARSCLAFQVDLLVFSGKNTAEIGPGAVKSSAGALLHLPVSRVASLDETLNYFKSFGIPNVGATEKGSEDLSALKDVYKDKAIALWIGNEDRGIPRERIAKMDRAVRISIAPNVDSLNVSVAAGIVLHAIST